MAKRHRVKTEGPTLQLNFGLAVKLHRKRLGITQEELAWRAEMHRTYIADIERGGRNITLRSLGNLAHALQVPLEELLTAGPAGSARADTPGEILLVEDSSLDVVLTKREFRRANVGNPIKVARDGEEALDILFATAGRGKRIRTLPSLILLDLGLPKMSGIEVLRRIKGDPRTRYIPVVILTASRYDRDILECARLGAENYVIKPLQFSGLCKVALKLRLTFALVSSESKSPPAAPTPRDRAAKSR